MLGVRSRLCRRRKPAIVPTQQATHQAASQHGTERGETDRERRDRGAKERRESFMAELRREIDSTRAFLAEIERDQGR